MIQKLVQLLLIMYQCKSQEFQVIFLMQIFQVSFFVILFNINYFRKQPYIFQRIKLKCISASNLALIQFTIFKRQSIKSG